MYYRQRTLSEPVHFSGTGVHSGKPVELTIKPAPPNFGIKFRRVDLPGRPLISSHFNRVVDTSLATVIGEDGFIVSTIEHLMATFAGLSIDNAIAELNEYEVPIMDGSAGVFTDAIRAAGIIEQDAPRLYFVIESPIELKKEGKSVCVYPAQKPVISCTIHFEHPVINEMRYTVELSEDRFAEEISRARTFGFYREIEYLKFYGLAQGGSLDNAVVIDENGVMNENGLRYPDEFVRHKILDSIGDFSLLGLPILGHIELYKSGHNFNHEFLQAFFSRKKAWKTMTLDALQHSRVAFEKTQ
ncbi:MAG: UDP-3-O-acyl-N-acetylglucosamine deacetylase [Thermodesulfobacteriota bacterium]